jgi:hypothetical protein
LCFREPVVTPLNISLSFLTTHRSFSAARNVVIHLRGHFGVSKPGDTLRSAGIFDEKFSPLLGWTKATTSALYGNVPQGILSQRIEMVEAIVTQRYATAGKAPPTIVSMSSLFISVAAIRGTIATDPNAKRLLLGRPAAKGDREPCRAESLQPRL